MKPHEVREERRSRGRMGIPSWQHVRRVLQFKTVYLALVLALIGITTISIGGAIATTGGSLLLTATLLAVGSTLLASSTISVVTEIYMKLDLLDLISDRIRVSLPPAYQIPVAIEPNRTRIDFASIIKEANGYLRIIGFSANDILTPQNLMLLRERLKLDKSLHVMVLLLNPWSVMALRRAEATTYNSATEFFRNVWAVMGHLSDMITIAENTKKPRFELRLYDAIPSLSMIIHKSEALVTPITCIKHGGDSPTFLVRRVVAGECPCSVYEAHFDELWQHAVRVSGSNLHEIYGETVSADRQRMESLASNLDEWTEQNLRA